MVQLTQFFYFSQEFHVFDEWRCKKLSEGNFHRSLRSQNPVTKVWLKRWNGALEI